MSWLRRWASCWAQTMSCAAIDHGRRGFQLYGAGSAGLFLAAGRARPAWAEHYPVHRADFRMDEDALPIGSAALVTAALEWMERKG